MRTFLLLAAGNGFISVAMGAFGAHALRHRVTPANLAIYEVGAHYHLVHAVALFGVALLLSARPEIVKLAAIAGWLFIWGIVFFAGSLYALAITNIQVLGAITPVGGLCFLAGWLTLFAAALRLTR